jgi:integrase
MMARSRVLKRALTQTTRINERAALGKLTNLRMSLSLKKRYDTAVKRFFRFLKSHDFELPDEPDALDELCCLYIEELWEEGLPRSWAAHTLSGLAKLCPYLKGSFPLGWTYYDTWKKHELPQRAAPLSVQLLKAMAGYLIFKNKNYSLAICMLLTFHCMLRISEALNLKVRDMEATSSNTFVLHLGFTKGGKRRGETESVEASDPSVLEFLRWLCVNKEPGDSVFELNYTQFRSSFHALVQVFGLNDFGLKSHSLRRGGTTFEFRGHGSYDLICQRGRWSNPRTARLYITESIEMTQALTYPKRAIELMSKYEDAYEQLVK